MPSPSDSPPSTPTPTTYTSHPPPPIVTNSGVDEPTSDDDDYPLIPVYSNKSKSWLKYTTIGIIIIILPILAYLLLHVPSTSTTTSWIFKQSKEQTLALPQQPIVAASLTLPNNGKTATTIKDKKCKRGDINRPSKYDFVLTKPKTYDKRRSELRSHLPPFTGEPIITPGSQLDNFLGIDNDVSRGLVSVYYKMLQESQFEFTLPFNTNRNKIIWEDLLLKNRGSQKVVYYCQLQQDDDNEDFDMKIGRCTKASCYCTRYSKDKEKCLKGVEVVDDTFCMAIYNLDHSDEEGRALLVAFLEETLKIYPVDFEEQYKTIKLDEALSVEDTTGMSFFCMFVIYLFLGPGEDSFFKGGESIESLGVGVLLSMFESMMQQIVPYEIVGALHEMLHSSLLKLVKNKLDVLDETIGGLLNDWNIIQVVKPNEEPTEWPVPKHLNQVTINSWTHLSSWEPDYDNTPPEGMDIEGDQDEEGYVDDDDEEEEDGKKKKTTAGYVRDDSQIPLTPLFYNMIFRVWNSKDQINPVHGKPYWKDLLEGKAAVYDPAATYNKDALNKAGFYLEMFMGEFEKTMGDPYFDAWETSIDSNSFVMKHFSYDVVGLLEKRGFMKYRRFEDVFYLCKSYTYMIYFV